MPRLRSDVFLRPRTRPWGRAYVWAAVGLIGAVADEEDGNFTHRPGVFDLETCVVPVKSLFRTVRNLSTRSSRYPYP
jgi:hypothetical protein